MNQSVERRRERRVPYEFTCSFQAQDKEVQAKTLNVSLRGFFVASETVLPVNSQISFSLKDKDWEKELELVGRIAHASGETGMGVEVVRVKFGCDETYASYQTLIQRKIREMMQKEKKASSES